MVGEFGQDRFTGTLYYANVVASMVCSTVMVQILRRNPELLSSGADEFDAFLVAGLANVCALVVAFVIALLVPHLQYYSLLVLVLVSPVLRFLRARGLIRV